MIAAATISRSMNSIAFESDNWLAWPRPLMEVKAFVVALIR
jgi:hypothetical protein